MFKRRGYRLTEEEKSLIKKMASQGYKVEYIAKKFNRVFRTIYYLLSDKEKRIYRKRSNIEKGKECYGI
jgi:IS30 family transposase